MNQTRESAGDPLPQGCVRIEIRVSELRQLFNRMDPSPFGERDLDPGVEAFIVDWAKEAPRGACLALIVHLGRAAGPDTEIAALRDAVRSYFRQGAQAERRKLRELLGRGRISLIIGLCTLAVLLLLSDRLGVALDDNRLGPLLQESLLIGGWVAMWKPLEVFLYDWWPIAGSARLLDRLAAAPVRVAYEGHADGEAWRRDWPAAPVSARTQA